MRSASWRCSPFADDRFNLGLDFFGGLRLRGCLSHVEIVEKTMTRFPLHPWERARRRRLLTRSIIFACAGGTLAGIGYQILVCIILR